MDAAALKAEQRARRKRGYRRLWRGVWLAFAGLVIVAALLLSLIRGAVYYSDHLRAPLSAWVEDQLGFSIQVGSVDMQLAGYRPQVVIDDLSVAESIEAQRLSFSLSIRQSLRQGRLVAKTVTLDGLKLPLIRNADGDWHVDAAFTGTQDPKAPADQAFDALYDQISRLGHLSLRDATVTLRSGRQSQPITFDAAVFLAPNNWSASGTLNLEGVASEPLTFNTQGQRSPQLDARFYLDVAAMDLAALQRRINTFGDANLRDMLGGCPSGRATELCKAGMPLIDHGAYRGQIWFDWQAAKLHQVTLDAAVTDLSVRRRGLILPQDRYAELGSLKTKLQWRNTIDGWRLDTQDLSIHDGRGRQTATQQVAIQERDQALYVAVDHADLGHLAVWLAAAPLPEAFVQMLDGNVPHGHARNVALQIEGNDIAQAYLQLEGFGNTSGERLRPVISHAHEPRGGLDLTLYRYDGGWLAEVDQHDLLFAMPGVFRTPLHIEQLSGRLYWLDSDEHHLYSPELTVHTPALSVSGGFNFRPDQADLPAFLDIDADFAVHALNQAPDYLPRNLIGSGALDWLDTYLGPNQANGEIHGGHFIFHGEPRNAPFLDGSGYFSVLFDFHNLTLPYQPDWPALANADGHIAFVNQQFHAGITRGRLAELPLAGARVSLFDLSKPELSIALRQQAPLADVLETLTQTPLVAPEQLRPYKAQGTGRFGLDLLLDLENSDRLQITGFYDLEDNSLAIRDSQIALEHLQGRLSFNRDLLFAEQVAGEFLDQPIGIDMHSNRDARGLVFSRLNATGMFDDRLWAELGLADDWQRFAADQVQGQAPFSLDLYIPHALEPIEANIETSLEGLALNIPAPFAKPAEQAWPLTLAMAFDQGVVETVSGQIEPSTHQQPWFFSVNGVDNFAERGQVALTQGATPAQPIQPDWKVSLSTGPVDVGEWQTWLQTVPETDDQDKPIPHLYAALDIESLHFGGLHSQPGRVVLEHDQHWQVDIDGPDIKAAITTQGAGVESIHLDVARLHIHRDDSESATEVELAQGEITPTRDDAARSFWPIESLPDIDAQLRDIRFDERKFSSVTFSGRPGADPDGRLIYRLSPFDVAIGAGKLEGVMRLVPDGINQQRTELLFSVENMSLESFLTQLMPPSPVEGGQIESMHLSMDWPGTPTDWQLATTTANLSLAASEGRIRAIEPGAGKLVGLFSLGALGHRLRLDFRDITEQGLRFERMGALAELKDGVVELHGLDFANPSVAVHLFGQTDLQQEALDLTAEVYADTGILLPLIGTVAGGPVVGGAVLALQEAIRGLGEKRHPQLIYHIGGTMENPEIERQSR